MMALIKVLIDMNYGPSAIFGTIALLRGIQGFSMGIMLVFVQVRKFAVIYLFYHLNRKLYQGQWAEHMIYSFQKLPT